jgi:hypothetical protein
MGLADTSDPAAPAPATGNPFQVCGCSLTSQATTPIPYQPSTRTVLGVGETVTVRVSSGPASWAVTGEGALQSNDTTSAKVVAGEHRGKLTVTATVNGRTCSIDFEVFTPIAHMRRRLDTTVRHTKGRPTCGFIADLFLEPKEVSFGALTVREEDSTGTGAGFYASYNGTGHRWPRGSTSRELTVSAPTGGTRDRGSQVVFGDTGGDEIWSGDPGSPIAVGSVTWPFSFKYRVSGGATWYPIIAVDDQHFEVDAAGTCKGYKAGAEPAVAGLNDDESGYR